MTDVKLRECPVEEIHKSRPSAIDSACASCPNRKPSEVEATGSLKDKLIGALKTIVILSSRQEVWGQVDEIKEVAKAALLAKGVQQ